MKKVYKVFMIILFILLCISFININEVYAEDNEENVKMKIVKVKIYDSKTKETREEDAINDLKCHVGDIITITANVDTGFWHVLSLDHVEPSSDSVVMKEEKYTPINPFGDNDFKFEAKNVGKGWIGVNAVKLDKSSITSKIVVTVGITEAEEQEKLIADAEKYNKELEIEYKTIPASDADAETINKFIKSDIQYNKSEQFLNEKISLELARTWSNTLNKAQTDNQTIKQYEDSKRFLNEYVNKLNGKSTDEDLKNSMNDVAEEAQKTIEANNQTIKNAKIKLSILAGSKGTTRTENVFKDDVLDDPNTYKPSNSNSKEDSEAATIIDKILSLITTIGTVISVLMLAILGVKYMLGSVEEKAEYKKDLVPYFIGAALLFGICTVVKILQSLGDTVNNL